MITVLGCFVLICSMVALIVDIRKQEQLEWFFFRLMIILSVFINIGYMFEIGMTIYFDVYGELAYITVCLIGVIRKKQFTLSKKQLIVMVAFLITVFAGFYVLFANINLPHVITWNHSQDEVYLGLASPQIPTLGSSNRYYFVRMILFMSVCLFSRKYFRKKAWFEKLICFTKNIFLLYFCGIFLEFLFNNLVSNTALRNFLLEITDVPQKSISTGYAIRSTMGWYGADGFFSEPSYISVSFFYLLMMFATGIKGKKDIVTMLIGGCMLVACGAQTGLLLLPLWLVIWIRSYFKITRFAKLRIKRHVLLSGGITILIMIIIYAFKKDSINAICFKGYRLVIDKLSAYLLNVNSGTAGAMSGSIRKFGNSYCYAAFSQCFLFGVGLGTTRGYGLLPGALACHGILGCISYIAMVAVSFGLTLRKNVFAFILMIAYFSSILTVYYMDMAAILLVMLSFSPYVKEYSLGKNTSVKERHEV